MTNRERLSQMSDDELAEWLCGQIFPDYPTGYALTDGTRYHLVRNFLKMEYKQKGDNNVSRD